MPPSDLLAALGASATPGLQPTDPAGSAVQPSWRSPRLRLLANGSPVAGATEAEVISNNHYAADRFRVAIALGDQVWPGADVWAAQTDILLDIQFSIDGGQTFVSLIQGQVDSLAIDVTQGLLRLDGRDLTAALIEARTQETFANRTSSEIATLLAQRHNLTPVVTATTTPVGRYYQNEHDRLTLNQFNRATTEWDLLVFLAGQEGFDVFVSGTSLHFTPASLSTAPALTVTPAMCRELRLERALTLARDIAVTVKSWNSRQQTAFTQTARANGLARPSGALAGPSGRAQSYVFVRPNLTMSDALQFAQQKLAELTQHERVWEAVLPGELSLDPRAQVALSGTGTDFDQVYFIDVIERSLSFDRGFLQRVRAKNTSPRTQTTAPSDTVGAVTG